MTTSQTHAVKEIYQQILRIHNLDDRKNQETALRQLLISPLLGASAHSATYLVMGMILSNSIPEPDLSLLDNIQLSIISLRSSRRAFDFYKNWPFSKHVSLFEGVNARSEGFSLDKQKFYNGHLGTPILPEDLGHMGCTLSHFNLWDRALIQEDGFLCVFEDDAVLMPYAKIILPYLISNMPPDADIVFINGRSSEKLYSFLESSPPYSISPGNMKLFSKKTKVFSFINNNYKSLPMENNMHRHWSGTDGYILTAKGLRKLKTFIHLHGIPAISTRGSGSNVDCILSLLTATKNDLGNNPIGFDTSNKAALDLLDDAPYLTGYVTSCPIVESRDKLGLNEPDGYHPSRSFTDREIDAIRDAALAVPNNINDHAVSLLEICHKYRPHGALISEKLKERKSRGTIDRVNLLTAQISLEKDLIFVHIPKCGGTSIDNSGLFSHAVEGHRSLSVMLQMLGPISERFRVLTLSRNPWDRLASAFYYLSEGGCGSELDISLQKQYVLEFKGDFSLFLEKFLKFPGNFLDCMHMAPAISFIKPSDCKNRLFVQKLEQLSDPTDMFEFVGEKFSIKHERKRRSYSNVSKVFNDYFFEGIREIYSEDVSEFGYQSYTLDNIKN